MIVLYMKIRALRKSDFDEYYRNELAYAAELEADPTFGIGTYGKRVTRTTALKGFSRLIKDAEAGNAIAIGAFDKGGRMIGIAEVEGNRGLFEAPHIGEIGVSVAVDRRGRGVGGALLKELIKRGSRYEILTGGLFSANKASKRLMEKFGFKRWGRGPRFAKRGNLYLDCEYYYLRLR